MKKYEPSNFDLKANESATISHPVECEIAHCNSLYVGRNPVTGTVLKKRGHADVYVSDHKGRERGICCYHFAKITDATGHGRLGCLQDANGDTTPESVHAYWETLDKQPTLDQRAQAIESYVERKSFQRGLAHIADITKQINVRNRT